MLTGLGFRGGIGALACTMLMGTPVAAAASAKAATTGPQVPAFDFRTGADYILRIRSGGLESFAHIPRRTHEDIGFSYVDLLHDLDQPIGRCETFGGAYWLGEEIEEGVLGPGNAPADAGDVSGGYRNPFVSRDVAPNLSTGENLSDRRPGLTNYFPPGQTLVPLSPDGPGYRWSARCADDTHGSGQGSATDVAGFQSVGSVSDATVDKATGEYVGTSRSYVLGAQGVSGFDSASSFMQIVNRPDEPAKITYRMSYFNSGDRTGSNGVTFGGSDIPIQQFADTFNAQARTVAASLASVGPAGAATLQPEVGQSEDGGRYTITISAGHGDLGLTARQGSVGEDQGLRIGSITFEGLYGQAN